MTANLETNPALVAQTHPYSQLQFLHSFYTKTATLATHTGQDVLSTLLANLVLFLSLEKYHLPSPVITLSISPIQSNFKMQVSTKFVDFDLCPLLTGQNG